ncbi:MAG: insulinase family protein [Leptospiraceae bacterium]|nr:insulinase family protein [Leptospiraceae bacterium]MCP5495434.1 insulinase family protein [Leptospiraceae bacterium]
MMNRPNSPTLAFYTKFRAGAVDEIPEISGTAHLLEHMLFKGTKNVGTKNYKEEEVYCEQIKTIGHQLDELKLSIRSYEKKQEDPPPYLVSKMKRLGDELKSLQEQQKKYIVKSEDSYIYEQHGQVGFNAYTTNDVTNYQIQLPANRIEVWARLESDRLKNPVLREYYTEREVIMEERRMRVENSGMGTLREKYISLAFDQLPYRKPVIGYASNIPFLDIYQTEDFFQKHYSPDNMVISIVGDQDFSKTESIVQKYFSDLKPSHTQTILRVQEVFHQGEKRVRIKYPNSPIMLMGWNKPATPHYDNSVVDVIDALLTKGVDSRLFKRLVLQEKIVLGVDGWNGDPGERYSNLYTLYFRNNSDADPVKIEEIVWEEIEKLQKGQITEEEITIIKNRIIADFLRDIDYNSTLADTLSYYEIVTGDWENLFNSYDKFSKVTIQDIKRVANEYFTKDNVTIANLIDSREKEKTKQKISSSSL